MDDLYTKLLEFNLNYSDYLEYAYFCFIIFIVIIGFTIYISAFRTPVPVFSINNEIRQIPTKKPKSLKQCPIKKSIQKPFEKAVEKKDKSNILTSDLNKVPLKLADLSADHLSSDNEEWIPIQPKKRISNTKSSASVDRTTPYHVSQNNRSADQINTLSVSQNNQFGKSRKSVTKSPTPNYYDSPQQTKPVAFFPFDKSNNSNKFLSLPCPSPAPSYSSSDYDFELVEAFDNDVNAPACYVPCQKITWSNVVKRTLA